MKSLLLILAIPLVSGLLGGSLDGHWVMAVTAPNGMEMDAVLRIETSDSIRMEMQGDQGFFPLEAVSLEGDRLAFTIPTSHGKITCILFSQDEHPDRLTGLCNGPAGESVAILTRKTADATGSPRR